MNRRWTIKIGFTNGVEESGFYEGIEDNSDLVAEKILDGDKNTFHSISQDNNRVLFYRVGDVSTVKISI